MSPSLPDQSVVLRLDQAYTQLTRNLIGEDVPSVRLPHISTRSHVNRILADHLAGDFTSVFLRAPASSGHRLPPRPELVLPHTSTLPIRAPDRSGNQPPFTRPSVAFMEDSKRRALKEKDFDHRPFLTLNARIMEGCLPTIRGSFFLHSYQDLDSPGLPIGKVIDQDMVFDTGCHRTHVCDELVSKEFRDCLAREDHKGLSYEGEKGVMTQVQGWLDFSNVSFSFYSMVIVCPRSTMPNHFGGVILGQCDLMDSMSYDVRPKAILRAQGKDIGDEYWGEIIAHGMIRRDAGDEEYVPL